MKLRLELAGGVTSVQLVDGRKIVDSAAVSDQQKLSETLLQQIDTVLRQNGISIQDVSKVEVRTDLPENYTSVRIIQAVAKGLKPKG